LWEEHVRAAEKRERVQLVGGALDLHGEFAGGMGQTVVQQDEELSLVGEAGRPKSD
jgi:hypothetical protein